MPKPQHHTGNAKHFIAPFEVVIHNKPNDCWVSILGKVLNITPLIVEFKDSNSIRPLIAYAGKDISHWFDRRTREINHRVHPVTGVLVPYCPHGSIPHINPEVPNTQWKPIHVPWWEDPNYVVGDLTKKVRPIRIRNMLTFDEAQINVCCEDSILRIAERYSIFNSDPLSYAWKYFETELEMEKNLEENGVMDERDLLTDLGLPKDLYVPTITIYYKDDFKWEDQ
ncbi:hypothetical protein FQA39_LY02619 [Lamprigera yunnana]|nr:hypothetical protein FQA39_LY02619 [Lamprigera yunnana]